MMKQIWPETWGGLGSVVVTILFFWNMIQKYCPPELSAYVERLTLKVREMFNPYVQISINEYMGGSHFRTHEAYAIVEAYLSINSWKDAKRLKAEMARKEDCDHLMLSMDNHEKTSDVFCGVQVQWSSGKEERPTQSSSFIREPDKRYYHLKFHKQHMKMITETYLAHVMTKGKEIQMKNRQRKLYTNTQGHTHWTHIQFEHPATFDTLAMDPDKKHDIMEDLLSFSRSKDFYARIGKTWKRGYLLYGPPGTGKSTMIAAIANLLNFDVYDLELTSVQDNTELRSLLTATTSKSIIVIEDIDCSLELTGQRQEPEKPADEKPEKGKKHKKERGGSKVTLSGLLNFIDGLWSASGGERLIVFTTNFVDKLDPALTRTGRMDKHIEMSYCTYEGFKVLAKNYLNITEHPLFPSIRDLMNEVQITPADVAENLMPKSVSMNPEQCLNPEQYLKSVICALHEKKSKKSIKSTEDEEKNINPTEDETETVAPMMLQKRTTRFNNHA